MPVTAAQPCILPGAVRFQIRNRTRARISSTEQRWRPFQQLLVYMDRTRRQAGRHRAEPQPVGCATSIRTTISSMCCSVLASIRRPRYISSRQDCGSSCLPPILCVPIYTAWPLDAMTPSGYRLPMTAVKKRLDRCSCALKLRTVLLYRRCTVQK